MKNKSNWTKVLYGEKPLKGILTTEEGKNMGLEFRKNFKLQKQY